MIKFEPGAVIHDIASGDVAGVGVILSGLATTTVSNALTLQEGGAADEPDAMRAATVYLTHGSVFGVLVTMTGTDMPGRSNIVSHGSSRGTHVFQVPASVIRLVRLLPDGMTHVVADMDRGPAIKHAVCEPAISRPAVRSSLVVTVRQGCASIMHTCVFMHM
jgi:hypothetical protein